MLPDDSCANTGLVRNIVPTAAARSAPVNAFLSMVILFR
jgi:hypothetical protein